MNVSNILPRRIDRAGSRWGLLFLNFDERVKVSLSFDAPFQSNETYLMQQSKAIFTQYHGKGGTRESADQFPHLGARVVSVACSLRH